MCIYWLDVILCFMINPIQTREDVALLKFWQQTELQLNPNRPNKMEARR